MAWHDPLDKPQSRAKRCAHRPQSSSSSGANSSYNVEQESAKQSSKGFEWSPNRSLELLHEMRVFVHANAKKVVTMGADIQKWIIVSSNLANPDGLDEYKLAHCSMRHFENMQRCFRAGLKMDDRVRASVKKYLELLNENSRMRLDLECHGASCCCRH
ncbi:unnamed protein product [Calypogeia fissa]